MKKIIDKVDESGNRISVLGCDVCNGEFTLFPQLPDHLVPDECFDCSCGAGVPHENRKYMEVC